MRRSTAQRRKPAFAPRRASPASPCTATARRSSRPRSWGSAARNTGSPIMMPWPRCSPTRELGDLVTRSCSMRTRSAASCRACLPALCPTVNLGTYDGRACSGTLTDAVRALSGGRGAAGRRSSTVASRAAISRATSDNRTSRCTRCRSNSRKAATWMRPARYMTARVPSRCGRCCGTSSVRCCGGGPQPRDDAGQGAGARGRRAAATLGAGRGAPIGSPSRRAGRRAGPSAAPPRKPCGCSSRHCSSIPRSRIRAGGSATRLRPVVVARRRTATMPATWTRIPTARPSRQEPSSCAPAAGQKPSRSSRACCVEIPTRSMP